MKIALLCHGTVLQPAIETLCIQNLLVGIGVPASFPGANNTIEHAATVFNLPLAYLSKNNLGKNLSAWLEDLKGPRKNNFRILGARIWVSFVRSGAPKPEE